MPETTDQKLDTIKAGLHLILNKLDRVEEKVIAIAVITDQLTPKEPPK